MLPPEVTGIHYLVPENPTSLFPANYHMMQNDIQSLYFGEYLSNYPNSQTSPPVHEVSNNSTSDEAEDSQLISVIDERKQRRMISNRESARRSRMRKQKHLDELWSQVLRLRTENHSLMNKLNCVLESHEKVVQENAKLKEETSDLRKMMTEEFQIGSPYSAFRDLEEITCNTEHLRAESSNESVTTSTSLLH